MDLIISLSFSSSDYALIKVTSTCMSLRLEIVLHICVYFGHCWQGGSISLYNARRVTIFPLLSPSLMTKVTLPYSYIHVIYLLIRIYLNTVYSVLLLTMEPLTLNTLVALFLAILQSYGLVEHQTKN